ncbi:MAG: NUDIX hydrolase [Asticcacaulis sp.]
MDLAIELSAVVVTVKEGQAVVLCRPGPDGAPFALPSGPFAPGRHRTFDLALRAFVHDQTGFDIGYVEQLYSFGDAGRDGGSSDMRERQVISVGYLALTPSADFQGRSNAVWAPFHRFFPWEEFTSGEDNTAVRTLRPLLDAWARLGPDAALGRRRVDTLFPLEFDHWNEERVLDRYELLYDAGLVVESGQASGVQATGMSVSGAPMASDHRRILATGLSRLRGKLKYRPVIFELMPERFTLLELQKSLEALSGLRLHKQNFRRALERTGFVTPLGEMREDTGGRPAALYRYDRDRFRFSPSLGLSLPRA